MSTTTMTMTGNRLQRFAHARGVKGLIVSDGMNLPSNPDANRRGIFEVNTPGPNELRRQ